MAKPVLKFLTDPATSKDRQLKGYAATFPAESERFSKAGDFVKSLKSQPGTAGLSDGIIGLSNSQINELLTSNHLICLERPVLSPGEFLVPDALFSRGHTFGQSEQPLFFREPLVRFALNKLFFPERGLSLLQVFYWGSLTCQGACGKETESKINSTLKSLRLESSLTKGFADFLARIKNFSKAEKCQLTKLTMVADGVRLGFLIEGSLKEGAPALSRLFRDEGRRGSDHLVVNLLDGDRFELSRIIRLTWDRDSGESATYKNHYFFIG